MTKRKYRKISSGDKILIQTSIIYIERCCNCGLVHYMTHKVISPTEVEKVYYLSLQEANDDIINRRKEEVHKWSANLLEKLRKL